MSEVKKQGFKAGDMVEWEGRGLGNRKTRRGKVMKYFPLDHTCEVRGEDGKRYNPYCSWLRIADESQAQAEQVERMNIDPVHGMVLANDGEFCWYKDYEDSQARAAALERGKNEIERMAQETVGRLQAGLDKVTDDRDRHAMNAVDLMRQRDETLARAEAAEKSLASFTGGWVSKSLFDACVVRAEAAERTLVESNKRSGQIKRDLIRAEERIIELMAEAKGGK